MSNHFSVGRNVPVKDLSTEELRVIRQAGQETAAEYWASSAISHAFHEIAQGADIELAVRDGRPVSTDVPRGWAPGHILIEPPGLGPDDSPASGAPDAREFGRIVEELERTSGPRSFWAMVSTIATATMSLTHWEAGRLANELSGTAACVNCWHPRHSPDPAALGDPLAGVCPVENCHCAQSRESL